MRNFINKACAAFLDWASGVFGPKKIDHGDPLDWVWVNDPASNDTLATSLGLQRVVVITSEARKNMALAEIAAERAHIIANRDKIKKSGKAFYRRLRELSSKELGIETGRLEFNGSEWVMKGSEK